MKKLILALFAAVLMAGVPRAAAQSPIFYNDDYESFFGFRGGVDITHPSLNRLKDGVGGNLGLFYNIPVFYNLYLEPGASFYYDTFKRSQGLVDYTAHMTGLRIPIELGYRFDFTYDFGVNLFTGVELDWGWSGKLKGKDGSKINLYNDEGNMKRCDIGWNFGLTVFYYRYSLTFTGTKGLLNRYRNTLNGESLHLNRMSITFAYSFLWE